jgi:hypothetical protein
VSAENPTFGCILLPFFGDVAKLIVFQNIKKEEQIDICLIVFCSGTGYNTCEVNNGMEGCKDVHVPCSYNMFFSSILCKLDTTSPP